MRGYRIMRVVYASLLIGIAIVLIYLVFNPSHEQVSGALPLNDPNAVLKIILSAINKYQLPLSGKGTAMMKMMEPERDKELFDNKELTVNFEFKGPLSRTDIFESSVDSKESRLRTFIVTDKQILTFTPTYQNAHIDKVWDHDRSGLDFHPNIFMSFKGIQLTKWLNGLMKHPPDYASVSVDTEGILHYIAGGHLVQQDGEGFNEVIKFSFDTNKELLPVCYYIEDKYVDPNKGWSSSEAKFKWTKSDSVWYISQAEYIVQPHNRNHIVFTVKNFTPNVDVLDADFTLNRMNIPDGTIVSDAIAGRTYPYGTDPNSPLRKN